ncbi:MAG: response regulator transcription factor, partial [Brachybacterium tyrofermentans]
HGFMVKDTPVERLVDAIRRVDQGLRVVDPELAAQSLSVGASPLTAKETEVLQSAASGGTTAQIAATLFLTEGTVRNHISSAIGKIGVTNRVDAVRAAADNGWI